jgi:acyl-CoA thioester hydrolase
VKRHTNKIDIRVYYEDTDCGGVVYYANYLKYMERGRTELMRELGFDLADLHNQGTLFVVAEANIKYRFSARYNDVLTVATAITHHSSVTLAFHYEIVNHQGVTCASGDVKAACVDGCGKIKRIPHDILAVLA